MLVDIFDSKAVNDERELYGAPFVAPGASCGGGLVVTLRVQAFGEEVVSNLASLGKAIYKSVYFEVDPPIPSVRADSVFEDEVFKNVEEFDTEILVAVSGCVQV